MTCRYHDEATEMGPCQGEVKTRHAMTAYHFEGCPNSPEDPNRDFQACDAHWEDYRAFWQEQWDEYYAMVRG